jgi:hypothetical protein
MRGAEQGMIQLEAMFQVGIMLHLPENERVFHDTSQAPDTVGGFLYK